MFVHMRNLYLTWHNRHMEKENRLKAVNTLHIYAHEDDEKKNSQKFFFLLFCSRRVPWSQKLRPYSYLASGFFFLFLVCWECVLRLKYISCLKNSLFIFSLSLSLTQFLSFNILFSSVLFENVIIFKLLFNVIICQIPFCYFLIFFCFLFCLSSEIKKFYFEWIFWIFLRIFNDFLGFLSKIWKLAKISFFSFYSFLSLPWIQLYFKVLSKNSNANNANNGMLAILEIRTTSTPPENNSYQSSSR